MANLRMTYNGSDVISLTPGVSTSTKTMTCKDKMMSTDVVFGNSYDANLVSANILRGKSVFGVAGDTSTFKTHIFTIGPPHVLQDHFDWTTGASWRSETYGDKGYIKDVNISSFGFGTVSGWIWKGLGTVWTKRDGNTMWYFYNGHARYMNGSTIWLTMNTTTIQIYQMRYWDDYEETYVGDNLFEGHGIVWGY